MPVRCLNCGLLQILSYETREFVAVEPGIRETHQLPTKLVARLGPMPVYERVLECLAGFPVRAEVDGIAPNKSWREHFQEVIERPRTDCEREFIQFQPGLSPKDHREMKLLAEVERRSADWREEDAKWKKQVEALAETRHQELRRDASKDSTKTLMVAIVSAILTFVGSIIAAIVTAKLTK